MKQYEVNSKGLPIIKTPLNFNVALPLESTQAVIESQSEPVLYQSKSVEDMPLLSERSDLVIPPHNLKSDEFIKNSIKSTTSSIMDSQSSS